MKPSQSVPKIDNCFLMKRQAANRLSFLSLSIFDVLRTTTMRHSIRWLLASANHKIRTDAFARHNNDNAHAKKPVDYLGYL
jgi:hypothetical protein